MFKNKILYIISILILFDYISSNNEDLTNRKVENEIFKHVNLLKENPQNYLNNIFLKYKDKYKSGDNLKGFNEMVEILKTLNPMPIIRMSLGLRYSAYNHSVWMRKNKKFSHTGDNGSRPYQRMNKFGTIENGSAENIFYGSINGEFIIVDYLVDGGIPSRGHRKSIINEKFLFLGVGVSDRFSTMNFAVGYVDNSGLTPLPGTPSIENTSSFIYLLYNLLMLKYVFYL